MIKRLSAEFIGTLWLVLGGCGSAVLAAAFPDVGIGLHGVSLAFGLTVLTMAYAVGHISGAHFNPAVLSGCGLEKDFPRPRFCPILSRKLSERLSEQEFYMSSLAEKPDSARRADLPRTDSAIIRRANMPLLPVW